MGSHEKQGNIHLYDFAAERSDLVIKALTGSVSQVLADLP